LRQNRDAKTFALDDAPNHGSTEGRMVHVRVAGDKDDVDLIPAARIELVTRDRQPAGSVPSRVASGRRSC
jgi:hypothetical protein